MGRRAWSFFGENGIATTPRRFMIGASSVAGQLCIRQAGNQLPGEAIPPTTTAAADLLGIFVETVTYSTTQADFDGFVQGEEGTAMVDIDPFAVYEFRASGGATGGTALNSTAPANILTNTSASAGGTTVTAAEVGTVSFTPNGDAGILVGRTGNNAGQRRRITAHTNSTSTGVTVPFPFAIAVGDTFLRFPWSKSGQNVQFTATTFLEADATIIPGTGAPLAVVDVIVDIVAGEAVVQFVSRDSQFNPLS